MKRTDDAIDNMLLSDFYTVFNIKYFRNRLPEALVVFKKMPKTQADYLGYSLLFAKDSGETPEIHISDSLKRWPTVVVSTLLHEMVHVSLPRNSFHGPRFEKEMLRLAKAGAFRGVW